MINPTYKYNKKEEYKEEIEKDVTGLIQNKSDWNIDFKLYEENDFIYEKINNLLSDNLYNWVEEGINSILEKKSYDSYKDLSEYFYELSWWKFDINFNNSISENFKKIIKYFSTLLQWDNYDFKKIYLSCELINKFLIINHWNNIESWDVYWINDTISFMIYDFIENSWLAFKKHEILYLNNIIDRFRINHTFLKKINYTSHETAVKSFSYMLNNMLTWIENIQKTEYWWDPENVEKAIDVFLINYTYIYWLYLNYLEENWLKDEYHENNYFNFWDDLSINDKKDKIFLILINIFKKSAVNSQGVNLWKESFYYDLLNKDINDKDYKIDDILNYLALDLNHEWYNSVIDIEVIHHIFSIFPEKIWKNFNIIDFAEWLLLNKEDSNHAYNVMKLRLLRAVIKKIDDFDIINGNDSGKLLEFLLKVEKNMIDFWSDFLFIYVRISLVISNIYSFLYKKEYNLLKEWKWKESWYSSNREFEEYISDLKWKILYHISFYSKLFWDDDSNIKRDDFYAYKNSIISNLFKYSSWDSFFEMWMRFNENERIYTRNNENKITRDVNFLLKDIINNNFDFDKVNVILDSVSSIFFKNICNISIKKSIWCIEDNKFKSKKIDLWWWYVINFDINKKFEDLFEKIYEDEKYLIDEISCVLSGLVDSNNKMYYNTITWLKNWNSFNSDIENLNEHEKEWSLVIIEFNKVFYKNWKTEHNNIKESEKIIIWHSEIIKNLNVNNWDFKVYHLNNNKYVLYFAWIDKDYYIKEINKSIDESSYDNLLSRTISWYSWKITPDSLNEWNKNLINSNNEIDINVHNELINVINNKPEDILIYLQWIVDNEWNVDKYECLTRVRKSDWSIMYPDQIFPTLEPYANLYYKFTILQIERWFKLVKEKNISLSINLSTQDLSRHWENLIWNLKELSDKYWKNIVSRITFEVLEDNYVNENMYNIISIITDLWFKLAIDDYWAWQSSSIRIMKMLKGLNLIKLDWDFVKELTLNKDVFNSFRDEAFEYLEFSDNPQEDFSSFLSMNINKELKKHWESERYMLMKQILFVKDEITLFQNQWMHVVCEYVENKNISDILIFMWVDLLQWYHYSKPFDSSILPNKD